MNLTSMYLPQSRGGLSALFYQTAVGLLLATLVALSATPTRAQTPFSCTNGVSYRIQGDPSALVQVNLRTGAATPLFSAATLGNRDLTGLGYNPLNNFLYAYDLALDDIVRIDAAGSVTNLSTSLPAADYTAGDVGPDGTLYLYVASTTTMQKVNLSTLAVTSITLSPGANLQDISISPDGTSLYGISANSGVLVRYATTGGAATTTDVGFGAGITFSTYIDNTGDLYTINNADSHVFEVVGPGNPLPESATQLTTSPTAAITNTDGARCILSSATTQTPFVCSAGQAFAVVGAQGYGANICTDQGNSSLAEYNLVNGTLVAQTGQLINSFNTRTTVNNLGYHPISNYLWGYRNGTNQLVRIGSERTVDYFGISGLSNDCIYGDQTINNSVFLAGDISPGGFSYQAGVIYLLNGFNGDRFIRVDLNPTSPTYLQKLSDVVLSSSAPIDPETGVDDFAFNPIDGNLYGVDGNQRLFRINPSTGAVTTVGTVSGIGTFSGYLSAFFDNAGALYIQPGSSNDTYRIPNVATDPTPNGSLFIANGATIGSNGDGARCPFSSIISYTLSGNVFQDANGLTDGIVNGNPISSLSGNTFYANLVNSSGNVVGTTTLTGGAYSFTGISANTSYSVVLSNTPGTIGSAPPSTTLTGGVLNTGENIGTTAGSDGLPNGVLSVSVATSNVTNVNFGVEIRPVVVAATDSPRPNPGGTTTSPVSQTVFSGTDAEDGVYPTNLTGRTVTLGPATGGTLFYNGTAVGSTTAITNFNPALLTVDPTAGGVTSVVFPYQVLDNAGVPSDPKNVTVPFTAAPCALVANLSANVNVCVNATITLSTSTTGATGTLSYQFTGPNGVSIVTTASSVSIASAVLAATGTYTVVVTDAGSGCTATSTVGITVINCLSISGNVFRDANGLTDGTVNGTPISSLSGNTFSANLVGPGGTVVATTTLTGGAYSFTGISANTSYSVVLSNTPGTIGSAPPSTSLTNGVLNTGENIGTTAGSDGTPNGVISVSVATSDVVNVNFGVEIRPVVVAAVDTPRPNPGGTTTSPVSQTVFSGTDAEDGVYSPNLTGRTVTLTPATNGTLFYNGSPVSATQVITNFDPTKITLDPTATGATTGVGGASPDPTFTYAVADNAGVVSLPATVRVPFTAAPTLTLSGNVFQDANGLTDGIVNGNPISSLSGNTFYANLVGPGGTVIATTTLTGGAYSFTGITANTSYSVVLSNTPGTIGSAPPSPSLTGGVLNTGENIGTTAGSDGTPNGVISVSVATSDVVNVNFGVEIRPVVVAAVDTPRPNPGGTTTSPVSQTVFSGTDAEDGVYPTNLTGRTVTLTPATNGTLFYNGSPVSATQVITNFDPTKITLDPTATGATTGVGGASPDPTFTYAVADNAGVVSLPATVRVPFTAAPMPVSLVSFTAKAQENRTVLLQWSTSWERANQAYLIERSKDLKTFEQVGEVRDVIGNSNSLQAYRFVDQNPHRGRSYYRLRQVDTDGSSQTYKAEPVVIEGRYGVYPNPVAGDGFTLELDEPVTAVLHLYDVNGREVSLSQSALSELTTKVSPSSKLAKGTYVLTVEERGHTRKHRLVVQ